MKFLSLFAFVFVMSALVSCQGEADTAAEEAKGAAKVVQEATTNTTNQLTTDIIGDTSSIEFSELEFDFGEIIQGDKVEHIFKFTNTGDKPLLITNARGSCGCTVPEYPRTPIAAGQGNEIKVIFDSNNKMGAQNKKVYISANTFPRETTLTIKGNIVKPAGSADTES